MKVHYINILLFAHPLTILAHNNKNKQSITLHTTHTQTNRSLCECELYEPTNYDNDPEMKKIMEIFNRQTSQRFHEYDERLKSKRMQCKERCDKESQKIILKNKIDKELMHKFTTLQTNIQSDAIPTCICEKSIADKVEKGCLRCGGVLGGGVAPGWGLISGLGYEAWLNVATAAATKYATEKGIEAGIAKVIEKIIGGKSQFSMLRGVKWADFITKSNYNTVDGLVEAAKAAINACEKSDPTQSATINSLRKALPNWKETFGPVVEAGKQAADAETLTVQTTKLGEVTTQGTQLYTGIGYSILAIVIIILIMVIIYLILRHRRKKKMKKKLQYIKLLEE
ncbi:rifin [Plasmodium reichenowi]|uniref:Rifin n=1 Tax=Plasmodium reichenowi TaxID=5854 RepID=A0A060RLW7_PLARE|nr:rifin [Plasmodium reichenowi]